MKSCCISSTSLIFKVCVFLNYLLLLQFIVLVYTYMDMLTCQILIPALESAPEIRVIALKCSLQIGSYVLAFVAWSCFIC